jgi:hypothetical protein
MKATHFSYSYTLLKFSRFLDLNEFRVIIFLIGRIKEVKSYLKIVVKSEQILSE